MPCNRFEGLSQLAAIFRVQRVVALSAPFGLVDGDHGHDDVGCGPVPSVLHHRVSGPYEESVSSGVFLYKGYDIVMEFGFEGLNGFDGDGFVCC